LSEQTQRQVEAKEEVDTLVETFPGLSFAEDIGELVEELEEITYLWTTSECTYNIFTIVRNYLDENYIAAPMTKTLHNLAYIHSGYVSILLEARKDDNGRENSQD
jgi:hypothetical protein